jgi:hypothetical protein
MLPPSVALLLLGVNPRRAGRGPGPAGRFEGGLDCDLWPLLFPLKVVGRSVWLTLASRRAYQQLLEKAAIDFWTFPSNEHKPNRAQR